VDPAPEARVVPDPGLAAIMRRHQLLRTAFLMLLMLSVATVVTVEAVDPAPEASGDAATDATPEASPEPELPPLDCKTVELLEKVDSWSVDCVAMWLENLGFPELRTAFTGNKIDGVALKGITLEKLSDDYGVSDEDQRKKIYYNLKDAMRKDNSSGNTNHYSQMFFWLLPFLGLYQYFSVKYSKQIEKAMKRYKKWQDARNPPKPVEVEVYDDGSNEWTRGLNGDVGTMTKEEKKAAKDAKKAQKKMKKVE